ncbi:hypothetical protein PS918_03831 [Pseudomonas fluorescens]|uniref:Type II secretion system protein I n=1 Tax=Pseudomonas fluorescens TaxID=294 RepID=A0A5E7TGR1_PSEFL|nr:type II secretion system minor pseudopilin GspI [Pseudomonas fluorescens]VVP97454.1 hypothetical protein PS918_03831 [Pseudomonas fluorescens]
MIRSSTRRCMGGFTLLEIMVALAIFATLTMAVLSASQYAVKQARAVEERLIAAWVADNCLNELGLQSDWVVGQSQRVVHMDRRDWWVRQRIFTQSDSPLLVVDVEVGLAGSDETLHRATGWLPLRDE